MQEIILVPGLLEPRFALWPLQRSLRVNCDHVAVWRDRLVFRQLETSVDRMADRIAGVPELDGPIGIVTHSFGDWVARAAIAKRPNHRVRTLVSLAPVMRAGFLPSVVYALTRNLVPEVAVVMDFNQASANLDCDPRIRRLVVWSKFDESLRSVDRIELKLLESYQGDGHVTFSVPNRMENVEFRQPEGGVRGIISQVADPTEEGELSRTIYEFEYDLSQALPEETMTIDVELIGNVPKTVRAPFQTHAKTDVISVWLLFPADRPYRTYSLVSYPVDRSLAASPMANRFAIDHPYGFLIGWSVVNPDPDRVYECRWTSD